MARTCNPARDVVQNAFITGIGNNLVSLLAAIMIFGTVFAVLGAEMSRPEVLEVMKDSGPASTGLTFIWMPQLFAHMPSGRLLAMLFFLGLSFAAFSSLISMIEMATRILADKGLSRKWAATVVGGLGFILGIPSALYLEFLGNQDFVWGIALMISGAFIAAVVIRFGAGRFSRSIVADGDWPGKRAWAFLIRFVVPLLAVALLAWWLFLSATVYAPETWYDPFEPYSVMTCLFQWGAAAGLFLLLNRWLVRRTPL